MNNLIRLCSRGLVLNSLTKTNLTHVAKQFNNRNLLKIKEIRFVNTSATPSSSKPQKKSLIVRLDHKFEIMFNKMKFYFSFYHGDQ